MEGKNIDQEVRETSWADYPMTLRPKHIEKIMKNESEENL